MFKTYNVVASFEKAQRLNLGRSLCNQRVSFIIGYITILTYRANVQICERIFFLINRGDYFLVKT